MSAFTNGDEQITQQSSFTVDTGRPNSNGSTYGQQSYPALIKKIKELSDAITLLNTSLADHIDDTPTDNVHSVPEYVVRVINSALNGYQPKLNLHGSKVVITDSNGDVITSDVSSEYIDKIAYLANVSSDLNSQLTDITNAINEKFNIADIATELTPSETNPVAGSVIYTELNSINNGIVAINNAVDNLKTYLIETSNLTEETVDNVASNFEYVISGLHTIGALIQDVWWYVDGIKRNNWFFICRLDTILNSDGSINDQYKIKPFTANTLYIADGNSFNATINANAINTALLNEAENIKANMIVRVAKDSDTQANLKFALFSSTSAAGATPDIYLAVTSDSLASLSSTKFFVTGTNIKRLGALPETINFVTETNTFSTSGTGGVSVTSFSMSELVLNKVTGTDGTDYVSWNPNTQTLALPALTTVNNEQVATVADVETSSVESLPIGAIVGWWLDNPLAAETLVDSMPNWRACNGVSVASLNLDEQKPGATAVLTTIIGSSLPVADNMIIRVY